MFWIDIFMPNEVFEDSSSGPEDYGHCVTKPELLPMILSGYDGGLYEEQFETRFSSALKY